LKIDYSEDKQEGGRIHIGEYLRTRVCEEERRAE
jgi:hypothetical protein